MRPRLIPEFKRRHIPLIVVVLAAVFGGGVLCGRWLTGGAAPTPGQTAVSPEATRGRERDEAAGSASAPAPEEPAPEPEPALPAEPPPSEPPPEPVTPLRVGPSHASWSVLTRVPTGQKAVALTIDLGDTATRESVQGIMALLRAQDVHCTWFVTGWCVRTYPDLVAQIASSGHELGNHTDTHPYCTSLARDQFVNELARVEDALAECSLSVSEPKYFRPPYGAYNAATVQTARDLGYRTAMWSATSEDYDPSTSPESAARTILAQVKPGGIILTHATPVSREMMPTVLSRLAEQGYDVVSLQRLIDVAHGIPISWRGRSDAWG